MDQNKDGEATCCFRRYDDPVGEVQWSEVPDDILSEIACKLIDVKDYISFSAVCKLWQSVYHDVRHHIPRQVPMLMLPTQFDDDMKTRSLYNFNEKKVYNSKLHVHHNLCIFGSSRGWLVTACNDDDLCLLLNPFLSVNNEIHLPSLKTSEFGDRIYIEKAFLSANPASDPNFQVIAISGMESRIVFCRPGDEVWTQVDLDYEPVEDIICYRDQFYFVDEKGDVFSCDLNNPSGPKIATVAPCPFSFSCNSTDDKYLVESAGDLILIIRGKKYTCCEMDLELIQRERERVRAENNNNSDSDSDSDSDDDEYYETYAKDDLVPEFIVFKLDLVELKWVEMKNLCGRIVFVGDCYSMSLSASDFPGWKPNCIHVIEAYTSTYYYGNMLHDLGFFDMDNQSSEQLILLESEGFMGTEFKWNDHGKFTAPPPVLIEPSLQPPPQPLWK